MSNEKISADEQVGIILQGIGGFYYVKAADAIYECRARGSFRREGITPLAGDCVVISCQTPRSGTVERILPRKNSLIRPSVANLDCLIIVASVADPLPNTLVIDKMIAVATYRHIEPVLVINKADLADAEELAAVYRTAGLPVFVVSALSSTPDKALSAYLYGKVCAFTGNSGVGKSSLLNMLMPELHLETGEISQKLGRGRHTTRSACLYPMPNGGYLVDTPGFSSLDLDRVEPIPKEQLEDVFIEFAECLGKCRFVGCAHIREKDCAVRLAVEEGHIARSRYNSYVALYEEALHRPPEWKK